MVRNLHFFNYCILLFLSFYLVIDTITGYCLNNGLGVSLSIPYKMLLIFFMALVTCSISSKYMIFYSFSIWFILISILFYILNGYTKNIGGIVQDYIKLLSPIVFYNYFSNLDSKYDEQISKIIYINFLVFLFNIFIGILGFGYHTYSYGIGIKGFFYAGNEIFLIIISILVIYIRKTKEKDKLILITAGLISTVLIGTKTAILAALLIIIYDRYKYSSKANRLKLFLYIFLVVVVIFYFLDILISNLEVIQNIIYNIKIGLNNADKKILDVFLSGRIGYLEKNIYEWSKTYSPLQLVFGGSNFYNSKANELDFFDTVLQHGVILTGIIIIFYMKLLFKAIRTNNYTIAFFNITILIVSQTAGHIWANLTGGLFFILANCYSFKFISIIQKRIHLFINYRR